MSHSTKARKPQPRFLNVAPLADGAALVRLRVGRLEVSYFLTEIGSDFGRGFQLVKPDATTYHVHLGGDGVTCDCIGFEHHRRCKHSAAVVKLVDLGRLPAPQAGTAPAAA